MTSAFRAQRHARKVNWSALYTIVGLQAFFAIVLAFMGLYTVARSLRGLLDPARRTTFDNTWCSGTTPLRKA